MRQSGIVVICHRPGLIRGGLRNPQVAVYARDALTPAQLAELVAEPEITVVVGMRLQPGDVLHLFEPGGLLALEPDALEADVESAEAAIEDASPAAKTRGGRAKAAKGI